MLGIGRDMGAFIHFVSTVEAALDKLSTQSRSGAQHPRCQGPPGACKSHQLMQQPQEATNLTDIVGSDAIKD